MEEGLSEENERYPSGISSVRATARDSRPGLLVTPPCSIGSPEGVEQPDAFGGDLKDMSGFVS